MASMDVGSCHETAVPSRTPRLANPAATSSAAARYSPKVSVRCRSSISIGRSGLVTARSTTRSQSVPRAGNGVEAGGRGLSVWSRMCGTVEVRALRLHPCGAGS